MSNGRLKILDWYVHQGAQYELFKLEHDFTLLGINNSTPNWNKEHRPLGSNVKLSTESAVMGKKFDVVILRSPVPHDRYSPFIKNGAVPIAAMQTTHHFNSPAECKHLVWNSIDAMNSHKGRYPGKTHAYIVHGYDPEEFKPLNLEENNRVLTVANVFKGRSDIMGYPLWSSINERLGVLDVIGHGNLDISKQFSEADSLTSLIESYNRYSVYFNPTKSSAMPRSRAEAAMCGRPLVTTDNYDIGRYFTHNKDSILTSNQSNLMTGIKKLLNSKQMRVDYGSAAREVAIRNFHIDEFLGAWENLLSSL